MLNTYATPASNSFTIFLIKTIRFLKNPDLIFIPYIIDKACLISKSFIMGPQISSTINVLISPKTILDFASLFNSI